jgi:hypothetical protein
MASSAVGATPTCRNRPPLATALNACWIAAGRRGVNDQVVALRPVLEGGVDGAVRDVEAHLCAVR